MTRPARAACLLAAAVLPLAAPGCGRAPDEPLPPRTPGKADVVFVATPDPIVDRMLELGEVRPGDVVYDLGCGDGKILIAAAKRHGVRAVGVEIDPALVERARTGAAESGVGHLVTIRQGDIFEADFSDATVVMLYLLPELNLRLKPRLARLPAGTRIVSHSFPMKGARPEAVETVIGKKLYLWRVPWHEE